jgi:hypothetical protein
MSGVRVARYEPAKSGNLGPAPIKDFAPAGAMMRAPPGYGLRATAVPQQKTSTAGRRLPFRLAIRRSGQPVEAARAPRQNGADA